MLSGGRLVLGVGYLAAEFRATGVPMERRRARFREHLAAVWALWAVKDPQLHGEFVSFDGIDAYPVRCSPAAHPWYKGAAGK